MKIWMASFDSRGHTARHRHSKPLASDCCGAIIRVAITLTVISSWSAIFNCLGFTAQWRTHASVLSYPSTRFAGLKSSMSKLFHLRATYSLSFAPSLEMDTASMHWMWYAEQCFCQPMLYLDTCVCQQIMQTTNLLRPVTLLSSQSNLPAIKNKALKLYRSSTQNLKTAGQESRSPNLKHQASLTSSISKGLHDKPAATDVEEIPLLTIKMTQAGT